MIFFIVSNSYAVIVERTAHALVVAVSIKMAKNVSVHFIYHVRLHIAGLTFASHHINRFVTRTVPSRSELTNNHRNAPYVGRKSANTIKFDRSNRHVAMLIHGITSSAWWSWQTNLVTTSNVHCARTLRSFAARCSHRAFLFQIGKTAFHSSQCLQISNWLIVHCYRDADLEETEDEASLNASDHLLVNYSK